MLHSDPSYTLWLYLTGGIVVNTFPVPFDVFDIIKGRHSRSVWVTISQVIPNPIDIPFQVINAVKSSSEGLWIVVDKILHSLKDLRGVSEPLQCYCTTFVILCQGCLCDTERRMISNGDDSVSEVIRGVDRSLECVLRVQLVETFREE